MIHKADKKYLLEELQKHGNVRLACNKGKISRSTYYRWRKENVHFETAAEKAIEEGRENMCDAAESVIFEGIRNKDYKSSVFYLTHNHPNYLKNQDSEKVVKKEDRGLFGMLKRSMEKHRLKEQAEKDRLQKQEKAGST